MYNTSKLREELINRYFTAFILIILLFIVFYFVNKNIDLKPYSFLIYLWVFIGIMIILLPKQRLALKVEKTMTQEEVKDLRTWGRGGYVYAFTLTIFGIIMGFVVRSENQTGSLIFFAVAFIGFVLGLYQLKTVKENK